MSGRSVVRWGAIGIACWAGFVLAAWPAEEAAAHPRTRQQDPAQDLTAAPEQSELYKKWVGLTRKRRELQSQLSGILTGFSLSNPEGLDQYRAQVEEVRAALKALKIEQLEAASAAYIEQPMGNFIVERDATLHLRTLLGEDREAPVFDPLRAHQLATQMLEAGSRSASVFRLAVRAAVAAQDFDAARAHAAALEALGGEINQEFVQRLETIERNWAAELAARERDESASLPIVRFETDTGVMLVQLFEDDAPNTVANFISLTESGFFNELELYSVQPGLVTIGGCPLGNGTGNAGYFIPSEADAPTARKHFAGSLATFHPPGAKDSSQFAFAWQPLPERDAEYTVFGRIIEGLDVLFRMPSFSATDRLAGVKPIRIRAVRVIQKRDHPYQPALVMPGEPEAAPEPAGNNPAGNNPVGNDAVPAQPSEGTGGGGGS